MDKVNVGVAIGLGVAAALVYVATRKRPAVVIEEPEPEPVIDAELENGEVYWAALPDWIRVYERWANNWPADTDLTFVWEIKNTGDVGAYFQVYLFTPGAWTYVDPGNRLQVTEAYHTPTLPVSPIYNYYNIYVLARKLDGTRIGAVWTSEDIEVRYV